MNDKQAKEVMDKLLDLYDWHVRLTIDQEDYQCGYADAIGQCILDIGKILGEGQKPYKYEAYKRIMQYETTEKYWRDYPKPVADYFPADVIRKNGGQL